MNILRLLRLYKKRNDTDQAHLLRIAIDKSAFAYNISCFQKQFNDQRIAAVLKSNAYGHGLSLMGTLCDKDDRISHLVVDSIAEAQVLRHCGIKKEILILGHIPFARVSHLSRLAPLIISVVSMPQAEWLSYNISFPLRVHIKVDTGMHRQGVGVFELEKTIDILSKNRHISVEGLLSHLADADGPTTEFDLKQLKQWDEAVSLFKKRIPLGIVHFSATAGTHYVHQAKNNLIRAGIGLYGFDNTKTKTLGVKPVLSFFARIVNIKTLNSGDCVGYNATFCAPSPMRIGVIPCGYYEGVPRVLSNQGFFYYNDVKLPIVGTVSMNLTTIDMSDPACDQLRLEDEIEVFSSNQERLNSIAYVARTCRTIPYEILIRLAPGIRRVIV